MDREPTPEAANEIEAITEGLYNPEMPYHNYAHAYEKAAIGVRMAGECEREGVEVSAKVVYYALLFHDAGYHEDHEAKGYASKEAYSAALAEEHLTRAGVDPEIVHRVVQAILCTAKDATAMTTEDKIVRRADISGMAADYATFLTDSRALKQEKEMMKGITISWEDWKAESYGIISAYLSQDLSVIKSDRDASGQSIFISRARENLERFMREPA